MIVFIDISAVGCANEHIVPHSREFVKGFFFCLFFFVVFFLLLFDWIMKVACYN